MARLVILRIAGALLVGLALCPLVPLLGRPQWPAWVGPFLGALFGAAMLRTKPPVKIVAALVVGVTINLIREFANPRIVFLTRWSMPIGFLIGVAVFTILARLNSRARTVAAITAAALAFGGLIYDFGGPEAIYDRVVFYSSQRQQESAVARMTTALPTVTQVEISPGVPAHLHEPGDLKPGAPVFLSNPDAKRLAELWRTRKFEPSTYRGTDRGIWYVRFINHKTLLLDAEIHLCDGGTQCTLRNADDEHARFGINDPGGFLLDALRKHVPVPDSTRSAIACQAGQALASMRAYPEAIIEYHEALRLDSSRAGADRGIAEVNLKLGHNDQAIKFFSSAIILWPENLDLLQRRAEVYLSVGNYPEAIDDLTHRIGALRIRADPALPAILDLRGQAYLQLGEFREATDDFAAALQVSPDNLVYRFHLRTARDAANNNLAVPVGTQPTP